jgi:hypothetical protein
MRFVVSNYTIGVVKSLFGLMMKSLLITVPHMTDQDSSLSSSFIMAIVTKSDQILQPRTIYNNMHPSKA